MGCEFETFFTKILYNHIGCVSKVLLRIHSPHIIYQSKDISIQSIVDEQYLQYFEYVCC